MIEGLQWVRESSGSRYAVMRYDSKYAAMITTSVWRAKKNKQLALIAQQEWQKTFKHKALRATYGSSM